MRTLVALVKKELKGYFDQPTGYILLVIFLGVASYLFFTQVFGTEEATMRPLFSFVLPFLLVVFVPAATMRLMAEEQRDGTLEILLTQPIRAWNVVIGKYLAGLIFVGTGIVFTLGMAVALATAGDLDYGLMAAQYIGVTFLTGSFVAIGLFTSSLTRNQIVAFILGFILIGVLTLAGTELITAVLPAWAAVLVQDLSPVTHFGAITRGVVRLGDVLYFLAIVAAFLFATYLMVRGKSVSHRSPLYRNLQLGVGGLLLISVVLAWFSSDIRARWDLTEKKLFTLSQASHDLLSNLEDTVTIKLFLSRNPLPQASIISRDVNDFFNDVADASNGNVRLLRRYPDPEVDDGVLREAQQSFVPPVQFSDRSEGELSVKLGFLGAAFTYADTHEVMPFINSLDGLEYRVLSNIQRMVRSRPTVVAFHFRHQDEEDTAKQIQSFRIQLMEHHRTVEVGEDEDGVMDLEGLDALIVPGPDKWMSPEARQQIDEYLAQGGSALFLVEPVTYAPSLERMAENVHSLSDYLEQYGIRTGSNVVFDMRSNETRMFPTQFGAVPLAYPYWPRVAAAERKISGGIGSAVLTWPSAIEISEPQGESIEVEFTPILKTTKFAGLDEEFFDLSPQSPRLEEVTESELEERLLAVAVTGTRCPPAEPGCVKDPEKQFRIIVATDAEWLADFVLNNFREHASMGVNWVDWLTQDDALAAIRGKGQSIRPIVFTSDTHRALVQWGNTVGGPALFFLVGLARYFLRRNRTRKVYIREG